MSRTAANPVQARLRWRIFHAKAPAVVGASWNVIKAKVNVANPVLRRPRLRWRTFMPKHLLWWGGVFLTMGGFVFCVSTTARLAGQFNNVNYTSVQWVSNPGSGNMTGPAKQAVHMRGAHCDIIALHPSNYQYSSRGVLPEDCGDMSDHQSLGRLAAQRYNMALHGAASICSLLSCPHWSVCVRLQLILDKVGLAMGGMLMLVGAGLHIAKEVGWLVSKGESTTRTKKARFWLLAVHMRSGAMHELRRAEGLLPCGL